MRTTVIVLIIGGLAVLGLLFLLPAQSTAPEEGGDSRATSTEEEQSTSGNELPAGFSEVTTLSGPLGTTLSLQHPEAVEVSSVAEGMVEVMYVGPEAIPASEITDGYYGVIDIVATDDLQAFAQSEEPLGEVTAVQFAGREALRFTTETELGPTQTNFLYRPVGEPSLAVHLTYSVFGTDADRTLYEEEVRTVYSTLSVTSEVAVVDTIQLAFLDSEGFDTAPASEQRGCDRVVFREVAIAPTTAPLTSALETLFSYEEAEVDGLTNFIAETRDTLSFERAEVTSDGVAEIFLSGELSGLAGVCDNPRARIQIEETALQFSTVDSVQLYLNGEMTDLQPDGQGVEE